MSTEDRTTHTDFPSSPGTVQIVSSDNIAFNVSSTQLARASGFFRTMLELPQPTNSSSTQPIAAAESAGTLEVILSLATASRSPALARLKKFSDVEIVLQAAEKYDMPTATDVLRELARGRLCTPAADKAPLSQYAAASRYGWTDIADRAFARLIRMPIEFDKIHFTAIDSAALLRLVVARQKRVDAFLKALTARRASIGRCSSCIGAPVVQIEELRPFLDGLALQFTHSLSMDAAAEQASVLDLLNELNRVTCPTCGIPLNMWAGMRKDLREWL